VRIAVLKEGAAGERRVAATPETVRKFIALGAEFAVESGAGETASVADSDYADAGATDAAPLPVAQWFNRAAPRVKSGEIVPEQLGADAALALLLAEPLLIRRPLMQRTDDGTRLVGFDTAEVERFVGAGSGAGNVPASLEGCAAVAPRAACPTPN